MNTQRSSGTIVVFRYDSGVSVLQYHTCIFRSSLISFPPIHYITVVLRVADTISDRSMVTVQSGRLQSLQVPSHFLPNITSSKKE